MTEVESDARSHVESVRDYYEANTRRFVRLGHGGTSIHRAVWGPGVTTRDGAIHWIDDFVVSELRGLPDARRILDLGCGVGASLLYVATRLDVEAVGVTLSRTQVELARELFAAAKVAPRVRCEVGDFEELDPAFSDFDLAFSIEAFVQCSRPQRFFASAARALRPGGRLILCDDFVERSPRSSREERWLANFREGWRAGALMQVDRARELASTAGLLMTRDLGLTEYLELFRPRDILARGLLALTGSLRLDGPYLASLRGGDALQRALRSGVLGYRVLIFARES